MDYPFPPSSSPSPGPIKKAYKGISVMWKVVMIIFLIIGLLIPLGMINFTIYDRQATKTKVQEEIAQSWGGPQTLLGPVLVVPYKAPYQTVNDEGQKENLTSTQLAYILPQQYGVNTNIDSDIKKRGIYDSIVYTSTYAATGTFNLNAIKALGLNSKNILWGQAFMAIGIPSMKGIDKQHDLFVNGKLTDLLPGVNGVSFISAGLHAPIALSETQAEIPFNLKLTLKGSQVFSVIPIGKQNTIKMTSDWASPSFVGANLPSNHSVTQQGFQAVWDIPYYARSYGQSFMDTPDLQNQIMKSAVGVELLNPVDGYRQSDRAVKYGVLFLVLTFATFFLFEVISKSRLHMFQYLLVGCAIALFYLLLIAISEVCDFQIAYGIASLAIVSAITLYAKAILGKIRKHAEWIIGGLLSVLYTYLYVLLQLEELSLLFGAIGLFVVLVVMMYITRNIDWYNEQVPA